MSSEQWLKSARDWFERKLRVNFIIAVVRFKKAFFAIGLKEFKIIAIFMRVSQIAIQTN